MLLHDCVSMLAHVNCPRCLSIVRICELVPIFHVGPMHANRRTTSGNDDSGKEILKKDNSEKDISGKGRFWKINLEKDNSAQGKIQIKVLEIIS